MRQSILYGVLISLGIFYFANPSNAAKKTQATSAQPMATNVDDFFVDDNWSDMFDWKLLNAFKSQNRNVIVSPVSLKIILALLYGGSAGETKEQLQRVLNFHENATFVDRKYKNIVTSLQQRHANFTVNFGTRIFMKMLPEKKFRTIANDSYSADIEQKLDFDNAEVASKHINKWAEQITEGRIRELVHPDDLRNLVMVVANALYFKGSWLTPFPQEQSHRGKFYISKDRTIDVDYMAISDYFHYADSRALQASIVRVPYQGDHYVMYFVLPNTKTGLDSLLDRLNPEVLRSVLNLAERSYVEMVIPKFNFNFQSKMDDILSDFGLDIMFGSTASFPGIVRGDAVKLVVSSIVQKAGIEINEEGSTAYAATDVQVVNKFGDGKQAVFNATHPFLFFIEDQVTGTILFSGKVVNPIENEASPLPSLNDRGPAAAGAGSHVTNPLTVPTGSNNLGPNSVPISSQSNGFFPPQSNKQPDGGPNRPLLPYPELPSNAHQQPRPQDERFQLFDFDILSRLDRTADNIFVSPASIKATLAMILEGARGASATQINEVLGVRNVPEARQYIRNVFPGIKQNGRTTLEAGNGIFISNEYQGDQTLGNYGRVIEDNYAATVSTVDFSNPVQASQAINSWVAKVTRNLITDVLSPDDVKRDAALVLANALYFKGDWKYEFNPVLTKTRSFHGRNKNCINVDMMQITETFNYDFNKDLNAHVVELPYADDTYSMLLIVPLTHNTVPSDINRTLNKILEQMDPSEVILHMPKFNIDYSIDLIATLMEMGVQDIFGNKANLTGITNSQRLFVDAMVHRARIDVGEKGTIAAAVTTASVVPLIGTSSPLVIADHPFTFLIFNKLHGHVIFEGIVNRPTEAYGGANRENSAGTCGQQAIKQPHKGSGRTNPVQIIPGIQQVSQQQLRTSNTLPRQPLLNSRGSNQFSGQYQGQLQDTNTPYGPYDY